MATPLPMERFVPPDRGGLKSRADIDGLEAGAVAAGHLPSRPHTCLRAPAMARDHGTRENESLGPCDGPAVLKRTTGTSPWLLVNRSIERYFALSLAIC